MLLFYLEIHWILAQTQPCMCQRTTKQDNQNEIVNKITKRFHRENLIRKNIAEGLKIESPKSPHFYLKPKLHKGVPSQVGTICEPS